MKNYGSLDGSGKKTDANHGFRTTVTVIWQRTMTTRREKEKQKPITRDKSPGGSALSHPEKVSHLCRTGLHREKPLQEYTIYWTGLLTAFLFEKICFVSLPEGWLFCHCVQALITEDLIRKMASIYIPGHTQVFQKEPLYLFLIVRQRTAFAFQFQFVDCSSDT